MSVGKLYINILKMELCNGILNQSKDSSDRKVYEELTSEILENFLFDLSSNINKSRKFTVLTGYHGMVSFDLMIQGIDIGIGLSDNICFDYSKKGVNSPIIVHLGKKHGMYKAIARCKGFDENYKGQYKVEIRKGTQVIDEVDTFKEAYKKYYRPATVVNAQEFHKKWQEKIDSYNGKYKYYKNYENFR